MVIQKCKATQGEEVCILLDESPFWIWAEEHSRNRKALSLELELELTQEKGLSLSLPSKAAKA